MAQGRSTGERDYSVDTRFGGKNGAYNGNSIKNKKDNGRKSTFQHYSSVPNFITTYQYYIQILEFSTTIHRYCLSKVFRKDKELINFFT